MDKVAEKRMNKLEELELNSTACQLSAEQYAELMSLYFISNDLNNSKALWNRIPAQIKSSSVELKALWDVGQAAWKRNQANIYRLIKENQWSEGIKVNMMKYKEVTCQRYLSLTSFAYTTIEVEKLSVLLGLSESEVLELVMSKGWEVCNEDGAQKLIKPKPLSSQHEPPLSNKDHLERLTRYILFLET